VGLGGFPPVLKIEKLQRELKIFEKTFSHPINSRKIILTL
jgi:hypothetical protein